MTTFAIGEVAVAHGLLIDAELNGSECIVRSLPQMRRTFNQRAGLISTAIRIKVEWPCGDISWIKPANLRKRHPPSTDESESRQVMLDCIERARRMLPCEVEGA